MNFFVLYGNRVAGQTCVDVGDVPGGGHPLVACDLGVPEQCRSLIKTSGETPVQGDLQCIGFQV